MEGPSKTEPTISAAIQMASQISGATQTVMMNVGTSASQNVMCVMRRTKSMEAGHKANPTDLVIEAASLPHTLGRRASSGFLKLRMSTVGLQSNILTLGLATTTTVATLMASRDFGATQRTPRHGGISAITVRMAIRESTAPFHQLAAAHTIAMAMPLWTWTVQMAAYATVPMGGPAVTARVHRRARLTETAVGMAQLLMLT